ncbi:MAG: ribosome-associated translation inhibitor RaiA [Clostridia bacterium]|nr:ribosome-associated translation inhibitor RaiA [Clostridia bacterium]
MKINIITRKVTVNDAKRALIEKKIGKLAKFFDENAEANITLSSQKDKMIVEVTIYAGGMIYRAEERDVEVLDAVDTVETAIDRQIRKNKTRLEKKLRSGAFVPVPDETAIEEEHDFKIIKAKTHFLKPMSPEEAILQMNLLGHEFYVFQNANTELTNIVYRRKDGYYGLIETAL